MVDFPVAPGGISGFPYSNVAVSGNLVAIASQVPFDDTGHLVGAEFAEQAHQVFRNLDQMLSIAGCTRADVFKITGYLARPELFDDYNRIYRKYFSEPFPARTTVACTLLVPGMLLQVDAFARKPA